LGLARPCFGRAPMLLIDPKEFKNPNKTRGESAILSGSNERFH
jgi:hypothetical protein